MPNADTERLLALVEERTGYRVTVDTIDTCAGDAEMISAAADHPFHLVRIAQNRLAGADYLVALQCTMLLSMWSHPLGIPKFRPIANKVAYFIKKAADWRGLARLSSTLREQTAQQLVTGLLHQLQSTPAELIGIEYCYRECPTLRKLQGDAMNVNLRYNTQSLKAEVKALAPPDIYEKNQIMCAALARFWCDLAGTEAAWLPYKSIGVDTQATELLKKFHETTGSLGERSTNIVDAWADELGLRSLYEWEYRSK
jgi:hypothetical protein